MSQWACVDCGYLNAVDVDVCGGCFRHWNWLPNKDAAQPSSESEQSAWVEDGDQGRHDSTTSHTLSKEKLSEAAMPARNWGDKVMLVPLKVAEEAVAAAQADAAQARKAANSWKDELRALRSATADTARMDLIERTCTYPWKDFGCWKFRVGKTIFSGETARAALDAALDRSKA